MAIEEVQTITKNIEEVTRINIAHAINLYSSHGQHITIKIGLTENGKQLKAYKYQIVWGLHCSSFTLV